MALLALTPWAGPYIIALLVGSCILSQRIGALFVGGYVGGRLRPRQEDANHEAKLRDGLQGALVWAAGVLISSLLLVAVTVVVSPTKADFGMAAVVSGNAIGIVLNTVASRATAPSLSQHGGTTPSSQSPLVEAVLLGETVMFFAAASLVLSIGAGWWAATKGGQNRDGAAHVDAALSDLATNSGAEKPIMSFMRVVVFVPGAVGFLLGLIAAPLIIGFRMGLELISNEFVHAFAPDRELGARKDTNGEIGRSP